MKKAEVMKLLEKYKDEDNINFDSLWDDLDLQGLIAMGYISKVKHPTLPLYIYNYTEKCQYEQKRNDITISHRWLIKDEQWNVVARSFNKIFNYEELKWKRKRELLENNTLFVREKLDGSLLIVFFYDWAWHTATRWSFVSEQAVKWKEILNRLGYFDLMEEWNTYLFEVIYPENRIVVNYWKDERCVFLWCCNRKWEFPREKHGFTDVPVFYWPKDIGQILAMRKDWIDWEEWFICGEWNRLFKVKFDEYIELHKARFSYNREDVFELIKQWVKDFSNVPDEYHQEIRDMIEYYKTKYSEIRKYCIEIAKGYKWDRAIFVDHIFSSILFAWIDFKDISPMINNLIKLEDFNS